MPQTLKFILFASLVVILGAFSTPVIWGSEISPFQLDRNGTYLPNDHEGMDMGDMDMGDMDMGDMDEGPGDMDEGPGDMDEGPGDMDMGDMDMGGDMGGDMGCLLYTSDAADDLLV